MSTPLGTVRLPVEQRLHGLDESFRALWYLIVEAPPEPFLRVLLDALASWAAPPFAGGLPSGVGVEGDPLRLYLPSYSQVTPDGGQVPEPPPPASWTFQPLDPRHPLPDRARAAAGRTKDHLAFVAAAARRGPTLRSGGRMVVLHGYGETRPVVIVYADDETYTDCFEANLNGSGVLEVWKTAGMLGARMSGSGLPPGTPHGTGIDALAEELFLRFSDRHLRLGRYGRGAPDLAPLPKGYVVRVHAALEEALGHLVRLSADDPGLPSGARVPSSVLRAGHLAMTCVVAREVVRGDVDRDGVRLVDALDPDPQPEPAFGPGPGATFDAARGVLVGPDGWTLAFESREDDDLLTPRRLRLRCRAAGLDWPVLITRRDRRPPHSWAARAQLLNRWQVDHQAGLEAWRGEGHDGLPDAGAWDLMRQFLEDALLCWGDSPASGPAPQSVETTGGWYDGSWHTTGLRRQQTRPAWGSPWTVVPTGTPASYGPSASGGPDGPRLVDAGFLLALDRDGTRRYDFVDLLDGDVRIRVRGVIGRLALDACWAVPADAPQVRPDDRLGTPESGRDAAPPSLHVWRRLRDAAENGLSRGAVSDVRGAWVLGVFDPSARRVAAYDDRFDLDTQPPGAPWPP